MLSYKNPFMQESSNPSNTSSLTRPRVVALILAGGTGERVGESRPKQYLEYGGESILRHTLRAFAPHVDDILVVCQQEWREEAAPYRTCEGGRTAYESLCNGVTALSEHENPATLVMIHDAVRPLVDASIITDSIDVACRYGNAIAAVPVYETLFSAPEDERTVRSMVRREGMYRAQTPHTFTLEALLQMMRQARALSINDAQSACTLAFQLGYELHLSKGDLRNFKITTSSDLSLYETLIP